jgi:hypothetical protein
MIRTLAIHQFPLGVETFTSDTIQSFIFAEIDVAVVINAVKNQPHRFLMNGISGANKMIMGYVQPGPQITEHPADSIRVLLRRLASFFRRDYDFFSMLIRAGKKKSFQTAKLVKTIKNIRHKSGIGVSNMGLGIHIINWCRYIKFLGQFYFSLPAKFKKHSLFTSSTPACMYVFIYADRLDLEQNQNDITSFSSFFLMNHV